MGNEHHDLPSGGQRAWRPENTTTFSLNNTDYKTLAGMVNWLILNVLTTWMAPRRCAGMRVGEAR